VSYETEEQQLQALKDWWQENGTPLVVGAVLGLAGFAGWKYWNNQKIAHESKASDAYQLVMDALEKNDLQAMATNAEKLVSDFSDTSYAILAKLALAKKAAAESNWAQAEAELNWIVSQHGDNELANIAKLRLARAQIEQDKLDAALQNLNFDEDSSYHAMANLIKGNALLAAGKKAEALKAFEIAQGDEQLLAADPTLAMKVEQLKAELSTTSEDTQNEQGDS